MLARSFRLLLLLTLTAAGSTPIHARLMDDEDATRVGAEVFAELDKLLVEERGFLESEQNRIASIWFGKAHTAAKTISEGGLDDDLLAEFHNHLDEFIRAMSGDADSHRTAPPTGAEAKKALKSAKAAKKKANGSPALREVAQVELDRGTLAADAVRYGLLTVEKVEFLLAHRGMRRITGDAHDQTKAIMGPSYAALRDALSDLVASDGSRAVVTDEAGAPLADQLAPVIAAIGEARTNLDRLRVSVPWADRRIVLAREDLTRLEKNLAKVAALRDVPKDE